jgi:hypothetical protein
MSESGVRLSDLNDGNHVVRLHCTDVLNCRHSGPLDFITTIAALGDVLYVDLKRQHLRCARCGAPVTTTLVLSYNVRT